jgi:hypothetical protein
MTDDRDGPGPDVIPRWLAAALRRLVPQKHRDEFLGDLAEEARCRAERDGARSARRWLVGEVLRSAPHLLRMRLGGDAAPTTPFRWEGAAMLLVIEVLHAVGSGVLDSTAPVVAMVAAAILVPALALAAAGERVQAWALGVCYALLLGARALSPTPLPDLMTIGFYVLLLMVVARHREDPDLRPRT